MKIMSEEIKKEVQDTELNPKELDKVAGGGFLDWIGEVGKPIQPKAVYVCEICGMVAQFDSENEYKEHMKSVHNIKK